MLAALLLLARGGGGALAQVPGTGPIPPTTSAAGGDRSLPPTVAPAALSAGASTVAPTAPSAEAATPAAAAATARAGGKLVLDLAGCLSRALSLNPGLSAAREGSVATRWKYYEARAGYAPSLEADVSHREQGLPPPFLGPAPFGARKVTDETVTLNQPLYTFGRVEATVRQRRQESHAARWDVEATRQQLVLDVKRAYFDALLDRDRADVVAQSLEQARRQLGQAQVNFKAGAAAHYDVIRAEADLAAVQSQLIKARHDYTLSLRTLANLISLEQEHDCELTGAFDERPVALDASKAGTLSLSVRPEVKELAVKLAAAREAVRVAQAGLAPTLSLSAAYDNSRGQRPPFDRSIELDNYTVALSMPLHDGGATHARAQAARAEVRRIEQEARRLKDQVCLEVSQALLRLDESSQVVSAATTSVQKSEEALDVASLGYRQGVRTAIELEGARLALLQARLTLLEAHHDRAVARATLERAVGQDL